MVANMTLWQYFADAGMVVKSVMFILVIASIVSWTFIIQRGLLYFKRNALLKNFKSTFYSGNDLTKFYNQLDQASARCGIERIFHSGFKVLLNQRQHHGQAQMHSIKRAMDIAFAEEMDELENYLPLLASIGSTMPYIGLFGTVWGIMTSFQALGSAGQATIAMVAPGISEALVATAMGLFAAIPAVLAYNRYTSQLDRFSSVYTTFEQEFIAILEQQGLLTMNEAADA